MSDKYTVFSRNHSLNLKGRLMDLSVKRVMGILNLTPDSFYDGGRYGSLDAVMKRVGEMIEDGADIIDVGGYSSRPGAPEVTPEEEAGRIFPVLEAIRKKYPELPLSVDTFRSGIASRAITEFGVDMINDISGGGLDDKMSDVITTSGVAYVLMHMKGNPGNMQSLTRYRDILTELLAYFARKKQELSERGAGDIIIDPGFGFAKTPGQNFHLLSRLGDFRIMDLPILVGVSRKSMIYKEFGTGPEDALAGTIVLNTIALINGADILRVHDVRPAVQAIRLVSKTTSN